MSTQLLLKKWARQREKQEQKIEKSLAAKDFFDKNRNLTSHFQSWTTPQFYQQSSEQIEKSKASQRHEEELEERRQRLREIRDKEEQEWQQEQENRRSSRPSTKSLTKINTHLAESLREEKRKSELESQLYSRWRFDATRDKIIHDSRSSHEALAKLSWLDKQVEQNLERERKEKQDSEREQRIQEETQRQEKLLAENRHVLDTQVRELRSMQESHLDVMRRHESESRAVKLEEEELRRRRQKVEELFQKWRHHVESLTKDSQRPMHNPRRIKMLIDTRIAAVRERIELDLEFLQNLLDTTNEESLKPLLGKFRKHLEDTANENNQIRSLYDSEAKSFLMNRELLWTTMTETRERLVRHSVTELLNRLSLEIEKAAARHEELKDVKVTHLRAIEHTNDLLKEIQREQSSKYCPRIELQSDSSSVAAEEDILDRRSKRLTDECDSIVNQLSSQRITPREDPPAGAAPRFGKKKIAWT